MQPSASIYRRRGGDDLEDYIKTVGRPFATVKPRVAHEDVQPDVTPPLLEARGEVANGRQPLEVQYFHVNTARVG
jgi:hypothetical protein